MGSHSCVKCWFKNVLIGHLSITSKSVLKSFSLSSWHRCTWQLLHFCQFMIWHTADLEKSNWHTNYFWDMSLFSATLVLFYFPFLFSLYSSFSKWTFQSLEKSLMVILHSKTCIRIVLRLIKWISIYIIILLFFKYFI